ncbi:hypothetical protein MSG28_003827 [Choristoneura fumiferana]|uniref:Uncharacterized protein n=1 Tax=Choristoneura fumiferana TaxID=7141 RepID=A0ACC0KH49_CHOFU|nr:hypothetical protein MSG28_003827 [Choristoneura fumiferana]
MGKGGRRIGVKRGSSKIGQTLKEAGFDEWSKGQPDYSGGRQDCGALLKGGFLDDNFCYNILPFICEKLPSSLLGYEDY